MDFDELNVMQEVDSLYERLDGETRKRFKTLFIDRFVEVMAYLVWLGVTDYAAPATREDLADELADLYLAGLLAEPNDVTHYAWDTEVLRKRDRAKEAVNAVNGKAAKDAELSKALRLWSGQMQEYADLTSSAATKAAFVAAGVKSVKWNTENDNKVCRDCDKLDGKVFPINKVPPPQHFRCRCWISPVV